MTESNRKTNIRDETERARQAMDSAKLLSENGLLSDAVSRLYYAVFHWVRALFLSKGFEPKSHEGTITLFAREFVKTAEFSAADSHIISRLMKYRQEADYVSAYSFTVDDYSDFEKDSVRLIDKIEHFLRSKGYLESR